MDMEKPIEKLKASLDTSRESSPEHNDLSDEQLGFSTLPLRLSSDQETPVRLRRTGSERLKDGAKALLRRVESIKSRRRKRQHRDGVVIGGPQLLDIAHISQKMTDMKCVDIITMSTPPSPVRTTPYSGFVPTNKLLSMNNNELKPSVNYASGAVSPNHLSPHHYGTPRHRTFRSNVTSPMHIAHSVGMKSGDESSSYCSDASQESSSGFGITIPKKRPSRAKRFLQKGSKVEDIGALSDSECHQMFAQTRKQNTLATMTSDDFKSPKISRGGSLNLGKESQKYKDTLKSRSFRSRSSARVKPDGDRDFGRKYKSS